MPRLALPVILAIVLAGAAAASRAGLEDVAQQQGTFRDPTWLPSGKSLRLVSFGHRLALSDLYWLRAVQYMGETVLASADRWGALYPLADIVTDLDPRHGYAYQVVGSNLGGVAHRYDEAERILKKGMAALPERWSLYWVHAVNNFLYEGDFAEAAEYARRAAAVGKRPHLALLAANLSLVTNAPEEYDASEAFLVEAIQQAETPELKAQLEQRLVKVRAYEALARLEAAIATYRARFGAFPVGLEQLVLDGVLRELPADPSGGTFEYAPLTGEVRSTVVGPRQPIKNTMRRDG